MEQRVELGKLGNLLVMGDNMVILNVVLRCLIMKLTRMEYLEDDNVLADNQVGNRFRQHDGRPGDQRNSYCKHLVQHGRIDVRLVG